MWRYMIFILEMLDWNSACSMSPQSFVFLIFVPFRASNLLPMNPDQTKERKKVKLKPRGPKQHPDHTVSEISGLGKTLSQGWESAGYHRHEPGRLRPQSVYYEHAADPKTGYYHRFSRYRRRGSTSSSDSLSPRSPQIKLRPVPPESDSSSSETSGVELVHKGKRGPLKKIRKENPVTDIPITHDNSGTSEPDARDKNRAKDTQKQKSEIVKDSKSVVILTPNQEDSDKATVQVKPRTRYAPRRPSKPETPAPSDIGNGERDSHTDLSEGLIRFPVRQRRKKEPKEKQQIFSSRPTVVNTADNDNVTPKDNPTVKVTSRRRRGQRGKHDDPPTISLTVFEDVPSVSPTGEFPDFQQILNTDNVTSGKATVSKPTPSAELRKDTDSDAFIPLEDLSISYSGATSPDVPISPDPPLIRQPSEEVNRPHIFTPIETRASLPPAISNLTESEPLSLRTWGPSSTISRRPEESSPGHWSDTDTGSSSIPLFVSRASPEPPDSRRGYPIFSDDDDGEEEEEIEEEESDLWQIYSWESQPSEGSFDTSLFPLMAEPATSPEITEDDLKLGEAALESMATKSQMPLIKEDLRYMIMSKHGHARPEDWTDPSQKLNDEEALERRRRINRQAAKRSRDRHRSRFLELKQKVFHLTGEGTRLRYERHRLTKEKETLRHMIERHLAVCDKDPRPSSPEKTDNT